MVRAEGLEDILDAQKLKYCYECGICTAACPVAEIIPQIYNPRKLLQRIPYDLEQAVRSREIWLCAWCYRCYQSCPQGLRVPDILLSLKDRAAEAGSLEGFREALDLIVREIPLPLACLYACFNPGRGDSNKAKMIEAVRALVADYPNITRNEKASFAQTQKQRIAIIGSGPAGLTAATALARMGYPVTVFESMPRPGGMLRWCIPAYRLPREAVDAEIQRIENLGVEFRLGVKVGKDLAIEEIVREGYEAIFIAIGAQKGRKLGIEGERLKGVLDALDFLRDACTDTQVVLGDKVVVIGGGDVAMDAARIARIALHLGAKDVTILYRRSREEMPANPWEVKETEGEGVKIEFLVAPKRILGEDGRARFVECVRMRLGRPDDTGRHRPIPIEGSEFRMEVDSVISAVGESPLLFPLPKGVKIDRGNTVVVDPFTLQTGERGLFAGGDVVRGPSTVIEAVVDGMRAARSIQGYLSSRQGEVKG